MNVVFKINGREAIPVRAIPLVTNWRFMSPDIVAHVLGGTGGSHVSLFGDLQSYQVEAGQSSPMKKDWWAQFPVKELQALSKKIKETEPDDVVGYATWRKLALKELPAGVFVWKDEYQTFHDENWNSRFRQTYCALKGWNGEESDEDVASQMQRDLERDLRRDDLVDDDPLKRELRESLEVLKRWREADFSPFMQVQLQRIVIEGFEAQYAPTPTASLASAAVDVKVAALLDKIDKCRESIQLWETRDISRASDAEIAQHKLEPLRAELALLEQRKRVMRGDFSGEPEPATMPAPVEKIDYSLLATQPHAHAPLKVVFSAPPSLSGIDARGIPIFDGGQYNQYLADKAERNAKGRYTMAEAAQVLADLHGLNPANFLERRMMPAFDSDRLRVIDPTDGGPVRGRKCNAYSDEVTPAGVDAWLEADGFADHVRWPATIPMPPKAMTVATEPKELKQQAQDTGPRLSTNKAALIAQHKHEWPTIDSDLKNASENGLSKAAKAGVRDWNEEVAMKWARSKNKLVQPTSVATLNSVMSSLPSRKHRLEG